MRIKIKNHPEQIQYLTWREKNLAWPWNTKHYKMMPDITLLRAYIYCLWEHSKANATRTTIQYNIGLLLKTVHRLCYVLTSSQQAMYCCNTYLMSFICYRTILLSGKCAWFKVILYNWSYFPVIVYNAVLLASKANNIMKGESVCRPFRFEFPFRSIVIITVFFNWKCICPLYAILKKAIILMIKKMCEHQTILI